MNGGLLPISVVIPTLNRFETIMRSVNSVLTQKLPPLEVIVVDDGSEDGTSELLRAADDQRIRVVSMGARRGAQAARNAGIKAASGEWIAFLDSDDEWLPEKLHKQVAALEKIGFNPYTVVHCDCYVRQSPICKPVIWKLPLVEGNDVFSVLLKSPGPMFQGMLTSKIALERIGWLDESLRSYQEWDTSIRLACECSFIHLRDPLFIYNKCSDDSISRDVVRDIDGYQTIIDKFKGDISSICGSNTWNCHITNQVARCLNYELWTKADYYLNQISAYNLRYCLLKLFRVLHLKPIYFWNLKEPIARLLKRDNTDD